MSNELIVRAGAQEGSAWGSSAVGHAEGHERDNPGHEVFEVVSDE